MALDLLVDNPGDPPEGLAQDQRNWEQAIPDHRQPQEGRQRVSSHHRLFIIIIMGVCISID